jgi:hypothetical protein
LVPGRLYLLPFSNVLTNWGVGVVMGKSLGAPSQEGGGVGPTERVAAATAAQSAASTNVRMLAEDTLVPRTVGAESAGCNLRWKFSLVELSQPKYRSNYGIVMMNTGLEFKAVQSCSELLPHDQSPTTAIHSNQLWLK